jgi:hypothetical protein
MTHAEVSKAAHEHRREYESGKTIQQIATATKTAVQTVASRLRAVETAMRRPGQPQCDHHPVVQSVKNGLSFAAAGRLHGLSRERVRQIARQHGLTTSLVKRTEL